MLKFNPTTGKLDLVNPIPAETDPVFVASEAAEFVEGDKEKLDGITAGAEPSLWEIVASQAQLKVARVINFAKQMAANFVYDNGTSFPTAPVTGQIFYRSDLKTKFFFDGIWNPEESYGTLTLYIDKTNGSDAIGQGYSSGSGAVKTWGYAFGLIPATYGGNITINVTGEVFTETVTLLGKNPSGNFTITIQGVQSTYASGLVVGTGSQQGTFVAL